MDTLAVFKSRSGALRLYGRLKAEKIACDAVSTPGKLKSGCGLSVVFPGEMRGRAAEIIREEGINSFAGFYKR